MTPDSFGSHLRALRGAAGLSQVALCGHVNAILPPQGQRGFDVTYLSKIENERSAPPSARVVTALAQVLGVDVDDLVTRSGHVPDGFGALFAASPAARAFWRVARDARWSEEDWTRLAELARRAS